MGIYPQQHLPGAALQAVLAAPPSATRAVRALDAVRFDGPIPRIIDDATNWVARSTPTAIVSDASAGRVTDQPTRPRDAVRELVGNALIHRDLAPWSLGETDLLRIDAGKLVIRNPGGLYGLKVSRLGHIGVTSARNATLARICQYLRLADGTRAAEVLASGIPTVLEALSSSGMPAPLFDDDGLRFTVVLRERQRELRGGSFRAELRYSPDTRARAKNAQVEPCRVEHGYRVRRRSAGSTQVRAKNPGRTLPRRTRVPGAACYRIGYPSWPVETTTCSAAFSRINLPSA